MPAECEWAEGCAQDGVPDGVPVYTVCVPNSDEILGRYCRWHAQKRVSQWGFEQRGALGLLGDYDDDDE